MASAPGSISSVPVGTVAVLVVGPSESRYGLILLGPNTGRVTFGSTSGVTLDNGPTLSATMGPLHLEYDKIGDIIKGSFWAIGDAAGRVVGFIECLRG